MFYKFTYIFKQINSFFFFEIIFAKLRNIISKMLNLYEIYMEKVKFYF